MYTMEEIIKDVPEVELPGVEAGEYLDRGEGTFFRPILNIDEAGNEAYMKKIEAAGFVLQEEHVVGRGVQIHTPIAHPYIFRKDNRILTASFYKDMNKIWFAVSNAPMDPEWTAEEVFEKVPTPEFKGALNHPAEHMGGGNYVNFFEGTTKEDYDSYLEALETAGFEAFSNPKEGLGDAVFCATYTRENLVVTVTHLKAIGRTSVSACFDQPLSEHLNFNEAFLAGNKEGAKSSLHFQELWNFGNSFVIQLKNGHFLVNDGGWEHDANYLLDYMENLTEEGEKPVIEGWFISHGHRDHCGVLRPFILEPGMADRVIVDGIYFSTPSNKVIALDVEARADISYLFHAAKMLRTSKGEETPVYRPQMGQRYYFSDMTVDILMAQEQLLYQEYSGDFNDGSTWCLFTMEGQKCLIGGDGCEGSMELIMRTYDPEYMKMDVFAVLHHGWNTRNDFTDFCACKTVLHTKRGGYQQNRVEVNAYLRAHSEEWLEWEDGVKVLTFPYEVGSYTHLPARRWIYHEGEVRP